MSNLENYILLNVIEVRQLQNGFVFTGKMTFKQLNQIFKLTERKESIDDPIDNSLINISKEDQEFQRQLSDKKLNEIQAYLKQEMAQLEKGKSLGLFPSSLILYNRSYDTDDLKSEFTDQENVVLNEELIASSYTKELDCVFYIKGLNDLYKLYVPKNSKITLIVDGQHRFFGTKLLYNSLSSPESREKVENFEFIITYLVGFDIYEVGQIFATVNFKQKPVNRSLYYDIFGSAPQTDREGNLQNDIRLAHDLALHLNNNTTSPIKDMIKLLGKGFGLFSQAFFVEKMIRVFRTKIWDSYLIDYINSGKEYKEIATFMKAYLSAIKEAYPSAWPERVIRNGQQVFSSYYYPYILCKTTGLGAFFRLIKDIYPKVSENKSEYKEKTLAYLRKLSNEEANILFAKDGPYGGSGSEGLQDKLYRELKTKFGLN